MVGLAWYLEYMDKMIASGETRVSLETRAATDRFLESLRDGGGERFLGVDWSMISTTARRDEDAVAIEWRSGREPEWLVEVKVYPSGIRWLHNRFADEYFQGQVSRGHDRVPERLMELLGELMPGG